MTSSTYFQTPRIDISGFLLINKPKGITSFDVIRQLRTRTGLSKMGHGGILDKNATGLLIVGIGKATKKLASFLEGPKKYTCIMVLGAGSDTHDWLGHQWMFQSVPSDITPSRIQKLFLDRFQGKILQQPPLYSALKKKGKKYYQYALCGQTIEIPKREVEVSQIRLISYMKKTHQAKVVFSVECSKGTYIRSLARDIGEALGTVGVVKELCRTHIGNYCLSQAIPLSYISSLEDIKKAVIS
jgi:tRNA pseudouridine55 synthase